MADNNNSVYAAAMQSAATIAGASFAAADSNLARKWQAEQAQINREYQTAERESVQEWNLDMWNLTNDWNLQQWHRQNEYDSPAAQMERARAAGINPNTAIGSMYGGGSASLSASPVSSSPMSGSMASYSDGLANSIMSSFSQLGVNTANMLNALADKNTKEYWLSYDQMTEHQRKKILDATADNLLKDIDLKDVNIDTAKVVLGNLAEMKEQELLNLRAMAKNIEADTRSTEASIVRDDALAQSTIDTNETMQSLHNQQTLESEERTEAQSLLNEFAKLVGCPPGTPEYLFIKKLYDEKKLTEFIDGAYAPLERTKWKPGDRFVPIEEEHYDSYDEQSFFGAKVLGLDNNGSESNSYQSHKKHKRVLQFSPDGTILNPKP